MKDREIQKSFETFIKYTILIFGAIFTLLPFIWMIGSSLKTSAEIVKVPPSLIPEQLNFINYANAWTATPFERYLMNTVIVSVLTTIGVLITTILAAFAFSRLNFPGKKSYFPFFLQP